MPDSPLDGVRSPLGPKPGGGPAPAFSPSSLYSSGSQGIWLDPSDLTTMFSDRAGTTPVTTPGTVVGLRLDKSKGLVLGAELVTNGGFATDTDWNKGTGWTISGGEAVATAVASGQSVSQPIAAMTAGKSYRLTLTISSISGGIRPYAGTGGSYGTTVAASGTYSWTLLAGGTGGIYIATSGTTSATIDNISVKELAGNHAVAPTDAARPIYGVEPKGGRRNLELQTQDFANAYWTKNGGSITATNVTAPDGTATANTLTGNGTGNVAVMGGSPAIGLFGVSWHVKSATETKCEIWNGGGTSLARFDLSAGTATTTGGGGSFITSLGNGWFRVGAYASSYSGLTRIILGHGAPTLTTSMHIWGVQVEAGSTATNYQRVLSAYDVTESGVATCHYVQYDGSDDSMSTAAIDFTGTDKMSVFAGVRKLSDAAAAIFLETATDVTASAAGSFAVFAPNGAGSTVYQPFFRGDVGRAFKTASPFVAPISSVLAISMRNQLPAAGDAITTRVNGVENIATVSSNITDAGNFGNWPLFIGRRNNTLLPFNGKDYGIVIVGKAASAGEITDTETWLAARTAQVTL